MFSHFSWSEALGGSFVFMVLVACSVVTFAIALERAYYYTKRSKNPQRTLTEALRKVDDGELREAEWLCRTSAHPLGPVAAVVFEKGDRSSRATDERIQVELSRQKLLLERNLGIIGTMAATAPLIGLLGTVWGIMRAFEDMARVGSAAPTVVAGGVAEALITTAAGLMVAIPAVMLYNNFSRRMNVMLITAENGALSVREALAATRQQAPSPQRGREPRTGGTRTAANQGERITTTIDIGSLE